MERGASLCQANVMELDVSEALLTEVQAHNQLKQVSQPAPMTFDAQGNLSPF